jgi:uncharacterized heparinase superfamily protein
MNTATASLYFHTIRHMKPAQILARIGVRTKRALLARVPWTPRLYAESPAGQLVPPHVSTPLLPGLPRLLRGPWTEQLGRTIAAAGDDLRSGRFAFVGETATYPNHVDWNDSQHSRLWQLNLHYFDLAPLWILDAAINGRRENLPQWQRLCHSWRMENRMGRFEAWNPYTLSRRIPNWIIAHQLAQLAGFADADADADLLRSLYRQAGFLYGNVEWDLPMNHLSANGRALCYAGVFFQGRSPQRWLRRGLKLIWQRLRRDTCSDGGHAERSPMYHLLVLQDCLECLLVSRHAGVVWPSDTLAILRGMTLFSEALQHADGDLPLFNDAAHGIAAASCEVVAAGKALLENGGRSPVPACAATSFFLNSVLADETPPDTPAVSVAPRLTAFPASGYYVVHQPSNGLKVVFDCGEVGISEVGAHAHSDLLSYEMSLAGQRLVVDTGTSVYTRGARRQFERGIRAHNTLSVDGRDTCQPWSDYRLARRGHPGIVRTHSADDVVIIDAGHAGFLDLPHVAHRRAMISFGEHLLVVDRVLGDGCHALEARLLFAPEVTLSAGTAEPGRFQVQTPGQELALHVFGMDAAIFGPSLNRLDGWYAPRFGELVSTHGIRMTHQGPLPVLCGHLFVPRGVGVEYSPTPDGWSIALTDGTPGWQVLLGPRFLRIKSVSSYEYPFASGEEG